VEILINIEIDDRKICTENATLKTPIYVVYYIAYGTACDQGSIYTKAIRAYI